MSLIHVPSWLPARYDPRRYRSIFIDEDRLAYLESCLDHSRRLVEEKKIEPRLSLPSAIQWARASEENELVLYKDFAPYSLAFCLYKGSHAYRENFIFNGGIILHGPHDRGGDGGPPSYSVTLERTNGWSVHT